MQTLYTSLYIYIYAGYQRKFICAITRKYARLCNFRRNFISYKSIEHFYFMNVQKIPIVNPSSLSHETHNKLETWFD
jgi:hypothetical protein